MQIAKIDALNFGLNIQPTTFRTKKQKRFLGECIDKYDSQLLRLDRNLATSDTGDMLITETKDGNTQITVNFHNFYNEPVAKLQKIFDIQKENFDSLREQLTEFLKKGCTYQSIIFDNAHKSPKAILQMIKIAEDYSDFEDGVRASGLCDIPPEI